jgi:uncharacterized protein YjiS (DUF1127 family)
MAFVNTAANLRYFTSAPRERGWFLHHLLRLEGWLDARASRRVLSRLDERSLADLGLSAADLERADPAASWQSLLYGAPASSLGPELHPRSAKRRDGSALAGRSGR